MSFTKPVSLWAGTPAPSSPPAMKEELSPPNKEVLSKIPRSNSGAVIGDLLHDHQKIGVSRLLFMENDYRSLYEAMVRHNPSLGARRFLDLSAFSHMWEDEGHGIWSSRFTEFAEPENTRPLQGKGMILADDMGTGKSLTILALIEASLVAANAWMFSPESDPEEPTYRLPKQYLMDNIYIDAPPKTNPSISEPRHKFWDSNGHLLDERSSTFQTPSGLRKCGATLIVCPKSVIEVWIDHLDNHWLGNKGWSTLQGSQHKMDFQNRPLLVHNHFEVPKHRDMTSLKKASIILTTYEALATDIRKGDEGTFHRLIFYRVVLDEGHRIRNTATQIFQSVESLHKRHIHVLTGTPIQNHLSDLHAYARLFELPCGLSEPEVLEEYCINPAIRKLPCADAANLRAWGDIFALRRLKKDLEYIPLPLKTIKMFWLRNRMLKEQFKGVEDRVVRPWHDEVSGDQPSKRIRGTEWLSEFNKNKGRQQVYKPLTSKGSIKMRWFDFFLDTQEHGKIVVFHHWKYTFREAKAKLKNAGYQIHELQSTLTTKERIETTKGFNDMEQGKICLLTSIMVGGEGLSMIGATACVFLDLMWNPAWHEQSMNRLHRQGQTSPVTVYIPVIQKTYENAIWVRQQAKRGFSQLLFPDDPPGEIALSEFPTELLQWLRDHADIPGEDDEYAEPDEDEGDSD
ncbi:uncharacterized protein IL334_004969 [Kwoniella shivajii]|uniref:Helicase n=1 Tax=Kwoniella shivajii TaxID=564305 RepID=A0ABZ1D392_9TREE|nr:hypothetical protein IL334_004969 [Kwoniella shivajii]